MPKPGLELRDVFPQGAELLGTFFELEIIEAELVSGQPFLEGDFVKLREQGRFPALEVLDFSPQGLDVFVDFSETLLEFGEVLLG